MSCVQQTPIDKPFPRAVDLVRARALARAKGLTCSAATIPDGQLHRPDRADPDPHTCRCSESGAIPQTYICDGCGRAEEAQACGGLPAGWVRLPQGRGHLCVHCWDMSPGPVDQLLILAGAELAWAIEWEREARYMSTMLFAPPGHEDAREAWHEASRIALEARQYLSRVLDRYRDMEAEWRVWQIFGAGDGLRRVQAEDPVEQARRLRG